MQLQNAPHKPGHPLPRNHITQCVLPGSPRPRGGQSRHVRLHVCAGPGRPPGTVHNQSSRDAQLMLGCAGDQRAQRPHKETQSLWAWRQLKSREHQPGMPQPGATHCLCRLRRPPPPPAPPEVSPERGLRRPPDKGSLILPQHQAGKVSSQSTSAMPACSSPVH